MARLISANSTAATLPPPSLFSSSNHTAEPPQIVVSYFVLDVVATLIMSAIFSAMTVIVVLVCARSAHKEWKKKLMRSLPKYTYDSSTMDIENNHGSVGLNLTTCTICLADYIDGDEISLLPRCGHRFHVQCIDVWFSSRFACPSCHQNLDGPPPPIVKINAIVPINANV